MNFFVFCLVWFCQLQELLMDVPSIQKAQNGFQETHLAYHPSSQWSSLLRKTQTEACKMKMSTRLHL